MLLKQIKWEDDSEEILSSFKAYFDEEAGYFENVHKKAKKNFAYWRGEQIDPLSINSRYEHPVYENRIFTSVETLVPMVRNRPPEPAVYCSPDDGLSAKLKEILITMWRDTLFMPTKLTQLARHDYLAYWGVIKFEYDPEVDNFDFSVRDPQKIWARHNASSLYESSVVIEECELELNQMLELYPEDEKVLLDAYGGKDATGTLVKYYELWTNDFAIRATKDFRYGFGKKKNPHWNWEEKPEVDAERVMLDSFYQAPQATPATNFFKSPRKPYEEFGGFRLGNQLLDDTSIVEQAIPLQDQLNRVLRQIDVVAQDNGLDILNSTLVDEDVADKLMTRGPRAKLMVGGSPGEAAQRLQPNRRIDDLLNDVADTRNALDNLFGTHSTTRGERAQAETLGGRQILLSADLNRGLPAMEEIASISQRIYDWMIQGIMVYYTTPHKIPSGQNEELSISRDDLMGAEGEPIEISVIVGQESVTPRDKGQEAKDAVQLAGGQMLDYKTLYEKLGYSDAAQVAYRTLLMKANPAQYIIEILQINPQEAQGAGQMSDTGEVEQAIQAILSGQPPEQPRTPNQAGLQMLTQFGNSPEVGQLDPRGKQLLADYMKIYINSVGGQGAS